MSALVKSYRLQWLRIFISLFCVVGLIYPTQLRAAGAVAECTSAVTSADPNTGSVLGDVACVAGNCALLLGAAAAAGAALGTAISAITAAGGGLGPAVGNINAAIQLGSWELVLSELRATLTVLNSIPGAAAAVGYVTAAIAKIAALIALMGTDMYKKCQKPLIDIGEVTFGPPEGGLPGVVHIPPATCGHEPNGPGRGWIDSCSQCCTRRVDEANDHCPATRDPAKTNCQNLINECTTGCEQYRRDVANGSRDSIQPNQSPNTTQSQRK